MRFLMVMMLLAVGAAAGEQTLPTRLPQEHDWQVTLRDYLAARTAEDFVIANDGFKLTEDYEGVATDELARDFIGLGNALGENAKPMSLLVPPEQFLLSHIETDAGIVCHHAPEAATWWLTLDIKGNPFRQHPGAKRRAAVMAMVNMIMLDAAYTHKWLPRRADYRADGLAGNMMQWAYAYLYIRDVLPVAVRRAFEEGLLAHLNRMEPMAPRDINTNMDMKEIIVFALYDKIFASPEMHKRCIRGARRVLFGDPRLGPATSDGKKGTFHPAGYIGEMDGPETSYNGLALFHLLEAAAMVHGKPGWQDFLPEVIDRMLIFKAFNTWPDPDGHYGGPSSWAKRTNADYAHDQRARTFRELTAAMLSEHGAYLMRDTRSRSKYTPLPSRQTMLDKLPLCAKRIDGELGKSSDVPAPTFLRKAVDWPDDTNYAYAYYVPGSYERLRKLVEQDSPLLRVPFLRDGDLNRCFDGEFWIAKQGNWGFQVETVPNMGRGYSNGGLAGGSLAGFWTKETGSVILGKLPEKWNKVTWEIIDQWTTHHLWGRSAKGKAFSSARYRTPNVRYDTSQAPSEVAVDGIISPDQGGPNPTTVAGALNGKVTYQRRFKRGQRGLSVSSEVTSDGQDMVSELWETLPIYLRDGRFQKQLPDTTIAFKTAAGWLRTPEPLAEPTGPDEALTELETAEERSIVPGTLYEGVEAVRLSRFGHHVQIDFRTARRVKLAAEIWRGAYQCRSRIHLLHIDLLGSAGALPERTAVHYHIGPVNEAAAVSGDGQ